MASFNEDDGVWRTIKGRRVFIREGESLKSAIARSGKFEKTKKNKIGKIEEFKNKKQSNNKMQFVKRGNTFIPVREGENKENIVNNFEKRNNKKTMEAVKNAQDKERLNKAIKEQEKIDKYRLQKQSNIRQESDEELLKRGQIEVPKLRKEVEKHYEQELEKLKSEIMQKYDNPDDFLKELNIYEKESLKGTRREKYDRGEGSKYFDIQREVDNQFKNRMRKLVDEIKKKK